MKILEVCTSEALGGLELYFVKCCEKFSKDKDLLILGYVSEGSLIHQNLIQSGISFRTTLGTNLFQRVADLLSVIKSFQPDIIHSHVKTDLATIALAKVFSTHKFRHVYTRQMNMPGKKKNPFHTFIYSKIDLLLAITKKLSDQVLSNTRLRPSKVRVLYYGVPETQKRALDIVRQDPHFKIGLVARLDAKKHQHVLIEAMDILNRKGLMTSAYLIGRSTDDKYTKKLEAMVSAFGLVSQVNFMGFVEGPTQMMSNFDVILLTSSDETFGLVLVEAMRAEVAVIGANGGGVPEIIDHEKTGLLFEPGNAISLAEALEQLMKDKNLKARLATAGKHIADKKFNEDIHFDTLKSLFQEQLSLKQ